MQEIVAVAPPERVMKDFMHLIGIGLDKGGDDVLLEGRYPKDGAQEVVISKESLKKFYSYNDNMTKKAIGKEVEIYGKKYTIVGIVASDICFLSFDENSNYGFYQYHPDTYSAFVDRIKKFRKEMDWYLENEVDTLFIYTLEGREESILDWLLQTYPANNYYSYVYSKIWEKTYNKPILLNSANINVLLFIILSCFIFVINKGVLQVQMKKIKDYENYYIKNREIHKQLLLSYVLEISFVVVLVLIGNAIYSSISYVSWYFLLLDTIIVYIPIILYIVNLRNKKME